MPSKSHEALWIATAPAESRPSLSEDLSVDVTVVGGGMCGLTTAHLLQERGLSVAVLEAHRIIEGVTGHTTAKLTSQHSLFYQKIDKTHGRDRALLHGKANQQAIGFVADLVETLDVDARMVEGPAYTYAGSKEKAKEVEKEVKICQALGLPASLVAETELPFSVEAAIRFEDQAHFHPRRYLLALAEHFEENGGLIYEGSPVVSMYEGDPCIIKTPHATVEAKDVVVATNTPVQDHAYFVTRMAAQREYGIAVRVERPVLEGMYISAEEPKRSVRPYQSDEGPMLVVVGESHPVGQTPSSSDPAAELEAFAREHFPVTRVEHSWSTQDFYPVDHLPMVGRYSPTSQHTYTATGFQGWGMTGTTVAAQTLVDLVTRMDNPLIDVYDPFRAGRIVKDLVDPEFVKLQAKVGRHFIQDRLQAHAEAVDRGQGKVVKVDDQRVALYRDEHGEVHARSAVCTHMHCIVAFNPNEKSWDCPCHGSRFALDGRVLHGPATAPLAELDGDTPGAEMDPSVAAKKR